MLTKLLWTQDTCNAMPNFEALSLSAQNQKTRDTLSLCIK